MAISVPPARPSRPPDGSATLTFVADGGVHSAIYRDTAGGYLVGLRGAGRSGGSEQLKRVATLACAYSLCQELETHRARR
jgi:hypothetical protein